MYNVINPGFDKLVVGIKWRTIVQTADQIWFEVLDDGDKKRQFSSSRYSLDSHQAFAFSKRHDR